MSTNFPYISQIRIKNCYTVFDVNIPSSPLSEFKHIVLTGQNGSGKTTVLNRISAILNTLISKQNIGMRINILKSQIKNQTSEIHKKKIQEQLDDLTGLEIIFINQNVSKFSTDNDFIFSFFHANRRVKFNTVNTVIKEMDLLESLKEDKNQPETFTTRFKQYLVNKKVYEAFDLINGNSSKSNHTKDFFTQLTSILRGILNDQDLELEFVQENFEFLLRFKDGHFITFNQLSAGFSAFLSIVLDLLISTDIIRKNKNDHTFQPSGIVLIDEPETHIHLRMQYEIVRLITELFPNVQLIIATHSPAIISSIKKALVYDLTSKQQVSDWLVGSSFSELMIKHFGLENEFSPIADEILLNINNAVREKNVEKLKDILIENEIYLTPSLRLEIESTIIQLNARIEND